MGKQQLVRVDRLFARLTVIYGAKFTAPIDDPSLWEMARYEWSPVVTALTDEQIRQAIEACKSRTDPWPPATGEFVRLALGLPEPKQAAARAARGDRDALAKLVRRETGDAYGIGMSDSRTAQRACEQAYRTVVERFAAYVVTGSPVEPAAQIEHELAGHLEAAPTRQAAVEHDRGPTALTDHIPAHHYMPAEG